MITKIVLDERGDLTAAPGSAPWAVAVRMKLQYLIQKVSSTQEHIDPYLEKLEETKAYEQLTDRAGNPFESALEFYEYPEPFGLGNPERIKERIDALRSEPGRPSVNGVNSPHFPRDKKGSTNKPYILARLARDHPEILADFEAGKYKSARQAGIAAGFVKDVKRIQVLADPEKLVAKIIELFTPEQILWIAARLLDAKERQ